MYGLPQKGKGAASLLLVFGILLSILGVVQLIEKEEYTPIEEVNASNAKEGMLVQGELQYLYFQYAYETAPNSEQETLRYYVATTQGGEDLGYTYVANPKQFELFDSYFESFDSDEVISDGLNHKFKGRLQATDNELKEFLILTLTDDYEWTQQEVDEFLDYFMLYNIVPVSDDYSTIFILLIGGVGLLIAGMIAKLSKARQNDTEEPLMTYSNGSRVFGQMLNKGMRDSKKSPQISIRR